MKGLTRYTDLIGQVASNLALPADLLEAQIVEESSGEPDAFRWEPGYYDEYIKGNAAARGARYGPLAACSYGLLQIMLETAIEIGFLGLPQDLFTPKIGLYWGAVYLSHLRNAGGPNPADLRTAIAAYNGGPKLLHVPEANWPPGVHKYVDSIYNRARG